jgi:hypothetical protein
MTLAFRERFLRVSSVYQADSKAAALPPRVALMRRIIGR